MDLTKWPRLLVVGESITPTQANEVLIRTCQPAYLSSNDKMWDAVVREVMGFADDTPPRELYEDGRANERWEWLRERWNHNNKRTRDLGIIGLEYLYTSRISSSWIGGPHGWCSWDGKIGCSNYNIGKWPSVQEVTNEWRDIAEALPFLDLTAQLITDEGAGELAVEWRVKGGVVTVNLEPQTVLSVPDLDEDRSERLADVKAIAMYGATFMDRERGTSRERLEAAVKQIEDAVANGDIILDNEDEG